MSSRPCFLDPGLLTNSLCLTPGQMEYVVSCVKHVFEGHLVLQFNVLNTLDDQQLRDVKVQVSCRSLADCSRLRRSSVAYPRLSPLGRSISPSAKTHTR